MSKTVTCGTTDAKRGFVRIVRAPQGGVRPDLTGRAPGRGAYLCQSRDCWDLALKRKKLDRSLRVTLSAEDNTAVCEYAKTMFPKVEA
jgi:predicted RNA-binding protein YlxR (DUF448 family)